ncbi:MULTISPECIES: helix-turn-helix domain-containing protein [Raoultella]|uniref:Helix-turn-helix domain-containing protein n=1 Tax=Raoultella ornithinolytica TaxID=54291 RepID=A0A9Q9MY17_RAOOR|nr:helix-turn-helix transcriptional regulator [Raoultella ornithinolytica]UXE39459.1 helix-turn-helix domain-containing protein [Raoultella ornithinolytica]HDH7788786.1 helix-turn-helix transcriptional regulator [Raoultella ornithinolytica]
MKSIHDIRRENLKDLITTDFGGVQSRLSERMGIQSNLVNRWVNGKKVIGDASARKIETAARRQTNWLDVDHKLSTLDDVDDVAFSDVREIVVHNLKQWMSNNQELSSQQRLADASGVSQPSINRILRNEVSANVAHLEAIATAFGRKTYELLLPQDGRAAIKYDHEQFALLPQGEKEKIESFIDFVIEQHGKSKS